MTGCTPSTPSWLGPYGRAARDLHTCSHLHWGERRARGWATLLRTPVLVFMALSEILTFSNFT